MDNMMRGRKSEQMVGDQDQFNGILGPKKKKGKTQGKGEHMENVIGGRKGEQIACHHINLMEFWVAQKKKKKKKGKTQGKGKQIDYHYYKKLILLSQKTSLF